MLEIGGQGRNRTADASLFRAEIFQSYHIDLTDLRPPQQPLNAQFFGTVMGQQFWPVELASPHCLTFVFHLSAFFVVAIEVNGEESCSLYAGVYSE